MRLLLLGPPGSGKGTQGERLAQTFGLAHIASGDLIRSHIAQGTDFGKRVAGTIASGNFAPNADIMYWITQRLQQPDARQGCVLDGFPRDLTQAISFDKMSRRGTAFETVIELVVEMDDLFDRLVGRLICPQCGKVFHEGAHAPAVPGCCDRDGSRLVRRKDDTPRTVERRLELYESVTRPLSDYYREQGTLQSVEATGRPDDVFQRIVSTVRMSAGGLKNHCLGV